MSLLWQLFKCGKQVSNLKLFPLYWGCSSSGFSHLQTLRESNPRLWFWRPLYYHCTKSLCVAGKWSASLATFPSRIRNQTTCTWVKPHELSPPEFCDVIGLLVRAIFLKRDSAPGFFNFNCCHSPNDHIVRFSPNFQEASMNLLETTNSICLWWMERFVSTFNGCHHPHALHRTFRRINLRRCSQCLSVRPCDRSQRGWSNKRCPLLEPCQIKYL